MKSGPVLVLLVASLLFSGCAVLSPAPIATPSAETATVATVEPQPTVTPTIQAVSFTPTFEVAPCPFALPPDEVEGETIRCGYVVVPEDRGDPQTDVIRLAVVVLKATGDDPASDPVILLSGGPGEKTVQNAVTAALILSPFRERRDVIVFDQRGVGLSEPALECPEVVQARYDLLDELDMETALRDMYGAVMACRDRLVAEGYNLAAYNTTENAADVADIRQALGYQQLNIYGGSYGSLLAQAVMRDHPQSIRSVIMGAVLPAEKSFFVNLPTTTVNAALKLLEACAADPGCGDAYPDLQQVLYGTVEKLNAEPVAITATNPEDGQAYETWLTGDDVFTNLVLFLYFTDIIPVLPQAIADVADDNYELMTQLTSQQLALYDLLSTGMELSVLCAEDLIGLTPADYLAERAKVPQPLSGRADPEDIIEYSFFGICDQWPVPRADPQVKEPVASDIPTLILEGEFDPVTPLAFAEAVARHLNNSYVYELPGVGHNVLAASRCARRMAVDFVDDPLAEPDDSCLNEMPGIVFDLPREEAAGISLEPITLAEVGLAGVAPAGWERAGPGAFLRRQNALDPAMLIYELPDMSEADFLQLIQAQLSLDEPPSPSGQRETSAFPWSLYSVTVQGVVVDIATTTWNDQTLVVLTQAATQERDQIYESVFLPAVDSLQPMP